MTTDDYVAKTIAVYDAIAKEYAAQAQKRGPSRQRKKFCSLLPKYGLILDAGCGSGRDSAYFVSKGFGVIGIDLSKQLLKLAKITVPQATFKLMDLRALSFLPNTFNGIWACASLLHIKHKEIPDLLKKLYFILKPKGVMYIHVKKGRGEEEMIQASDPSHKRLFSLFQKDQLISYLADAGFGKIECEEIQSKTDTSVWWLSCLAQKSV